MNSWNENRNKVIEIDSKVSLLSQYLNRKISNTHLDYGNLTFAYLHELWQYYTRAVTNNNIAGCSIIIYIKIF